MKKRGLFLLILLFFLCGIIAYVVFSTQAKKNEEIKRDLEHRYYKQNNAFELSSNLDDRKSFHGADELRRNRVVLNLYVYNNIQTMYKLTIDEVEEYLKEEYSSDSKLKIYTTPENISDYISWYCYGGDRIVLEFGDWFNDYLSNHDYPQHSYRKMNDVDVIEALKVYSGDPAYVSPEQCAIDINE